MHYIVPLLAAALAGGLFCLESSVVNYSYERNPGRLLTLCGFSAGTDSRSSERQFIERLAALPGKELRPLLVLTGGFLDGIRGYTHRIILRCPRDLSDSYDIYYRQHQEKSAVRELIELYAKRGKSVVVAGHSWGGDTAARAAQASGAPIDLLITLDPVSRKGPPENSASLKRWLNIYIDYDAATWLEQSNDIARIGGPWGKAPAASENVVCAAGLRHKDAADMFLRYAADAIPRPPVREEPQAKGTSQSGNGASVSHLP